MLKFLGNVFSTVIGLFVFILILFFGIVIIGSISGGDKKFEVQENSVLELDLSNVELDYAGKTIYKDFAFAEDEHNGLFDIIAAIEFAKTDTNIKGISILNNDTSLGMAQIKALRDALEDFKTSKKFIYSYADVYSQKNYYLNSVANTLYINPIGAMDFKGLGAEIMFYKDFQDKSGLQAEIIRHGKYKSAVEPFLQNKMSDANREQTSALLTSLWNSITADISKSRNVSVEKLNAIADGLLSRTPEMAKAEKLIDVIGYEDEYHLALKKMLKVADDEDYEKVAIEEYASKIATTESKVETDKIAIIYAQGEISSGEGDVDVIAEGSMRRAIEEAREDDEVKAIVLRVNSPGGSALTSELIWRELEITKKVKPIVVSMGNYAASGGYYISCNANQIFAEASTITGSIGVFGILPNFTQAATKIGLNVEQIKTNTNASEYSPFTPLTPEFRSFAQEGVEKIYDVFLTRVANGRKMTKIQVDSIGQGRVWSGADAIKIGLVDKIGGLKDALKAAAILGKTKTYSTVSYPEYEKDFNDVLKKIMPFAQSKQSLIKDEIGEQNYKILNHIKQLNAQKGIQARMLFEMKIE